MAELIEYPKIDEANIDEWRVMIEGLQSYTRGLLLLDVENMDNDQSPVIKTESVADIGGSKCRWTSNEGIEGGSYNEGERFIYLSWFEAENRFILDQTGSKPVWSAAKGGWYGDGVSMIHNARAIMKYFYIHENGYNANGHYNGKIILDSYNSMFSVNRRQEIPKNEAVSDVFQEALSPGFLAELPEDYYQKYAHDDYVLQIPFNNSINSSKTEEDHYLEPGAYCFQLLSIKLELSDGLWNVYTSREDFPFFWDGGKIRIATNQALGGITVGSIFIYGGYSLGYISISRLW